MRYNTAQYIPVGAIQAKKSRINDPNSPVVGAQLSWYYWHYLRKADGSVVDIVSRLWYNVPNCAGCYQLGLATSDVNVLGPLMVYIFDANAMQDPVFVTAEVVTQNYYDSKYGTAKLSVETFAMKG